jgi:hypothetical protein
VTAPRAGRGRPGWPMAAHQLASAYKFSRIQRLGLATRLRAATSAVSLDPTGAVNVDRSVWAFNAVFLDFPMAPDVPQDEFRLIVRNGPLGESCPGQ